METQPAEHGVSTVVKLPYCPAGRFSCSDEPALFVSQTASLQERFDSRLAGSYSNYLEVLRRNGVHIFFITHESRKYLFLLSFLPFWFPGSYKISFVSEITRRCLPHSIMQMMSFNFSSSLNYVNRDCGHPISIFQFFPSLVTQPSSIISFSLFFTFLLLSFLKNEREKRESFTHLIQRDRAFSRRGNFAC